LSEKAGDLLDEMAALTETRAAEQLDGPGVTTFVRSKS
jgi:hypothetical protein